MYYRIDSSITEMWKLLLFYHLGLQRLGSIPEGLRPLSVDPFTTLFTLRGSDDPCGSSPSRAKHIKYYCNPPPHGHGEQGK